MPKTSPVHPPLTLLSDTPQSLTSLDDILINKLVNGEESEGIQVQTQEDMHAEGKDVTAKINALKREALSTDISLKSWITDHKTSIDLHEPIEEQKVEEEEEDVLPPPPLDDISAQPIL